MESPTPASTTTRIARLQDELLARRRAEEALRQSETRLRVLLERGGDVVYRYRPAQGFEYISPGVVEMTGYGASEVHAAPDLVFDIVHADDRQLLAEYLQAGDLARPLALRLLRRDGEVIWVEHLAMPAYDAHGRLTLLEGIVREVTAWGQVLGAMDHRSVSVEERERLMSALRHIGAATLGSLELDDVVDTLAQQVVHAGIFRSLMVALVDGETRTVRVVRNYLSFDGRYDEGIGEVRPGAPIVPSPTVTHRDGGRLVFADQRIIGTTYDLDDDNITPTVARTGVLTVIDGPDRRYDERFEPEPSLQEDRTAFFIPVCRGGRVLAVLATGSTVAEKAETLRRIEAMQPLFEQAAIALDHALIHGHVRDHARQLADLNGRLRDEVSRRLQAEGTLRDFSARTVQLAEDERRRVARELHDSVNQLLCAVGFSLEAAILPGPGVDSTARSLTQTRSLLDRTIREVRRISNDLRPGVLDDLGLAAALRSLSDGFTERTGVPIDLDVADLSATIPPEVAISLYRLLQEALHQVSAPTASLGLTVRGSPGQLAADLVVAGPEAVGEPWGDAIAHLRERAGLLGGTVGVDRDAAGDARLRVHLPLPAGDAEDR